MEPWLTTSNGSSICFCTSLSTALLNNIKNSSSLNNCPCLVSNYCTSLATGLIFSLSEKYNVFTTNHDTLSDVFSLIKILFDAQMTTKLFVNMLLKGISEIIRCVVLTMGTVPSAGKVES